MMGYGEKGLIPRICEGIFARSDLEKEKAPENSYIAEVNYLEIYNEKVRDLLVTSSKKGETPHALKVRENPKTGPFVEGLTSHKVTNYEQILALMDEGMSRHALYTFYTKAGGREGEEESTISIAMMLTLKQMCAALYRQPSSAPQSSSTPRWSSSTPSARLCFPVYSERSISADRAISAD